MFRIARVIINFISETLAQSESEQDEGQGVETPAPSASSSSSNFKSQFHSEHNFNVTKNGKVRQFESKITIAILILIVMNIIINDNF